MKSDLIHLLKKKMTSTTVSHEQVVEVQQKLGGEIFVPTLVQTKYKRPKSSSIACNTQQFEILLQELVSNLHKDGSIVRRRIDIHTLGLILLHDIVEQLVYFKEKLSVNKLIDYLFIFRCIKQSSQKDIIGLDVSEEISKFQLLKGEDRRTVNYYEEARTYQDAIQLHFLTIGNEKISVGDIHLLALYVLQEVYRQVKQFHPQAILDYGTFQQYVKRIPNVIEAIPNQ